MTTNNGASSSGSGSGSGSGSNSDNGGRSKSGYSFNGGFNPSFSATGEYYNDNNENIKNEDISNTNTNQTYNNNNNGANETLKIAENTFLAMEKRNGLQASITLHTSLIPMLVLVLTILTVCHVNNTILGNDLNKIHHDPVWHQIREKIEEVSELLDVEHYFDDDDRMQRSNGQYIEAVLNSHWQSSILWWLLTLNALLVIPFLARQAFLRIKQTYNSMMLIFYLLVLSTIVQLCCVVVRIGIGFIDDEYTTIYEILAIIVNIMLFMLEALTAWEIHQMKYYVVFFANELRNLETKKQLFESFLSTNSNSNSSSSSTTTNNNINSNINNNLKKINETNFCENSIINLLWNKVESWKLRNSNLNKKKL